MAEADTSIELLPADLASGDGRSLGFDCRDLEIVRIQSSHDPLFSLAYDRLWAEFGAQHEMESREVIAQRLAWHSALKLPRLGADPTEFLGADFQGQITKPGNGARTPRPRVPAGLVRADEASALLHELAPADFWMRYEIILVLRQGQFVAVRDHTAVVTCRRGVPCAMVHLSHILVDAQWRRTGLTGWLRAWPIQAARACLAAAGFPVTSPITLVLEMEHPDPAFEKAMIRIKAYEKAGFKKVDPAVVNYFQPDFRPPEEIDASGGPQPLPFCLLLRRLGREDEHVVRGAEIRELVGCLYRMYGTGLREKDMTPLWQRVASYPAEAEVALLAPSQ